MKIEASRSAFSSCNDRFMKNYKQDVPFEEQCRILESMRLVDALPITYTREADPVKLKRFLADHGLRAGTIVPNTYSDLRYKNGTLSNRNPEARAEITRFCAEAMDFCEAIGGVDVMLWLGHDGYDYPFEDDYSIRWGWLVENLHRIVSHRNDVHVAIEYKPADPRIFQYISNAAKALVLCNEVGLENLGVILDYGHALVAGETPAESVALLSRYKRLFHIHLSDNYSKTDDDMLIGSVSLWQTLDFLYQLQEVGFDGWYVMDIWPPRMDGIAATKSFVKRARGLWEIARTIPRDEIRRLQGEDNVPAIMDLLGSHVLKI
jgi:xylose isomerase